ncbi:septum formation inhibitor Maf [Paenibacillus sp. F411]|uniref:Maf family protein n=1 Tax=Paenibacillus sp. F411 TaxID=2820239 RepID=UPI001AAEC8BA|nr:septum formation inhibitor Maf [Paenibacillus sp. F411]
MTDNRSRRQIVLASTSPRRQELIQMLGLPVEVMPSGADEDTPAGWKPEQVVESLALRKAEAVLERCRLAAPAAVIVGSDTVVVLDGEILGKPRNPEEAVSMLSRLQGRRHAVYTGIACVDLSTGTSLLRHRVTTVAMKPLLETQIESYVRTGEPMDKAGAYGIQGLGAVLVESIEGDYFNVVGLSISMLSDMLLELGISVLNGCLQSSSQGGRNMTR